MSLTLYYHPLSSYCHKVLVALYELGTSFDARIIDLSSEADRALLEAHWPLCKFPVIHDSKRGRTVPESSTIIEYLDEFYPGSRPLIPRDADRAIDVRLWDRVLDNYVHSPMQQIVGDRIRQTRADLSAQRTLMESTYHVLDGQLRSREWIASEDFSLADCAAAPALFYGNVLQRIPPGLANLSAYFERLMGRPSIRRTLEQSRPYFNLFPFADELPERFRNPAGTA
jgi:glutathione S-transferase